MKRFAAFGFGVGVVVLGLACGNLLGGARDDSPPVLSERMNLEGGPFFKGEVGSDCSRLKIQHIGVGSAASR